MVSPSTALRAQAAICAAFWMGMTAFPAKLTSAYALDFFDCPKAGRGAAPCSVTNQKIMAYQCFSLFGIQILFWGIVSIALARRLEKAQSVACFSATCIWLFFLLSDFLSLMDPEGVRGAAQGGAVRQPRDVGGLRRARVLRLEGERLGGAVHRPEDGAPPVGAQFGTAITVLIGVNLIAQGLPVCFLRQAFIDSFTQGFMDGFSPLIKGSRLRDDGQFGKMMLCNAFNLATIASVGDEDAQYRMLRAISVAYMFYLGSVLRRMCSSASRSATRTRATRSCGSWTWPSSTSNAWAKAPYTLKKSSKATRHAPPTRDGDKNALGRRRSAARTGCPLSIYKSESSINHFYAAPRIKIDAPLWRRVAVHA